MYTVFTNKDRDVCIKYIQKRLREELYINLDIVFEDNLQHLFNHSKLLKVIDKLGGVFQSYEGVEDRVTGDLHHKAKSNCVSLKIRPADINVFFDIFKILIKKKIVFEVRVYE